MTTTPPPVPGPPPPPRLPPPPGTAEAGWRPDENPYLVRYWDGTAWTEHTAPRVFGPPAPVPPAWGAGLAGTTPVGAWRGGPPPVEMTASRSRRSRRKLVLALSLVALVVAAGLAVDLARYLPAGSSTATTDPTSAVVSTDRPPFRSCAAARRAGAVPLTRDHPRWNPALDRDGDGVACRHD